MTSNYAAMEIRPGSLGEPLRGVEAILARGAELPERDDAELTSVHACVAYLSVRVGSAA
jgi:hypothetical protein